MRHIAVTSFSDGPCNGQIEVRALRSERSPSLRLPILGAPASSPATEEWLCTRCGQRWAHEPLPQEAL